MHDDKEPVYPVGVVAKLLKVCPATLRIWEKRGLIAPARRGKDRFYSRFDVRLLERIKELLQARRINIEGVKSILRASPCWEIKKCASRVRSWCPVYSQRRKT